MPQQQAQAAPPPAQQNVITVAAGNPDLSVLVAAVKAAGLQDALANPSSPITVFAPTNEAFAAALQSLQMTQDQLLGNKDLLTKILEYHVALGILRSSDLQQGQTHATLLGPSFSVTGGALPGG